MKKVKVRRSCSTCGRTYTFDAEMGRVMDSDPGCPDCEPENHEHIEFNDEG